MEAIPGVVSAALGNVILLDGDSYINSIHVDGHESAPGEDLSANIDAVSPGFFSTMGIPLLRGRDFSRQDGPDSPKVAIVNETFARQYFGDASPLGRKIGRDEAGAPDIEIVGVAKDTKYDSLRGQIRRMVYFPAKQQKVLSHMVVHVRTAGSPEPVLPAIRREMAQIDPALAIPGLETMRQQVDKSLLAERLIATLCSSFGTLATLLAAIGLYGVTAFSVARRRREIGIRMALGAERARVLRMVLKEVALLCVLGVLVGLPAAAALARLARSQLYGVKPSDPVTLAGAAALMLAVSLMAGFLPARRAAAVEPVEALRYE